MQRASGEKNRKTKRACWIEFRDEQARSGVRRGSDFYRDPVWQISIQALLIKVAVGPQQKDD